MPDGAKILLKDNIPEDISDTLNDLGQKEAWKVLIVDDDEDVHREIIHIIGGLTYLERKLQFFHAYDEHEARKILVDHPDIAIILLEMTMEDKNIGMQVVQYIREVLMNRMVRIILCVDRLEKAPALSFIIDYDINDCKEKAALTPERMAITVLAALRAYQLIIAVEYNRRGLKKIIQASACIFEQQNLHNLGNGILTWLASFLRTKDKKMRGSLIAEQKRLSSAEEVTIVLAATGIFEDYIQQSITSLDNAQVFYMLEQAQRRETGLLYAGDVSSWYLKNKSGSNIFLYFEMTQNFEENEYNLLELFFANVGLAFSNLFLHKSVNETQNEIIFHITEAMEYRSQETGSHVRRVSEYAHLLALKCGLDKDEAEMLRIASTAHDLGKIGIPDAILNKPGPLTEEEYAIIKTHVYRGYDLLIGSSSPVIQMAARIILQHHERWDGRGYPLGLKGEEIHIHGRIVGVADVFDAISNNRVYHKAWDWDEVLAYFKQESGKHFDPNLVHLLIENKEEFREIWVKYSDGPDIASILRLEE